MIDSNDGEPDARQKLELEKRHWLEIRNGGLIWMMFENIQSDQPKKEVRGQS